MIIEEITGDIVYQFKTGKYNIAHGCNCFNSMGAGLAKQVRFEYPEAFKIDCNTVKGDKNKLGTFTKYYNKEHGNVLYNAYTQYDFWTHKPCDYKAIEKAIRAICVDIVIHDDILVKNLALPLIGAGLAGGDWDRIKNIINDVTKDFPITIVHFRNTPFFK